MQDHFFRSYSSHLSEYRVYGAMKRTFAVVQRAFQFTRPEDHVDAQISYLINPRNILIIYSNIAIFNVMPLSNTHCATFLCINSHVGIFGALFRFCSYRLIVHVYVERSTIGLLSDSYASCFNYV